MEQQALIDFLNVMEKLKCTLRHGWTTTGREESVAEHSWRLAVMAMLLVDDFPQLDMDKVVKMCLVHDWGEALTGDVPTFLKTVQDCKKEEDAIASLLHRLPEKQETELAMLFDEMDKGKSSEAKLFKALDKLEALIQHNESSTETWLPLEHELQQTYGIAECDAFEYTKILRELVRQESARKTSETDPSIKLDGDTVSKAKDMPTQESKK